MMTTQLCLRKLTLLSSVYPTVTDSLVRDLARIDAWCKDKNVKLNPSKLVSMVVSTHCHSYTHSDLALHGNFFPKSTEGKVLGFFLGTRLTFGPQLCFIVSNVSHKLVLLRRSTSVLVVVA